MKKISLLMLTLLLSVVSFAQKPVSGQRAEVFPGPQSIPADMVSVKLDYEKDAYTAPWRVHRAASDYNIITEQPEGTLKQYTRAGSYIGGDGYIYSQSGFADIVFAADGTTVYFKDLVACYEFGTWVKGTIEGNTITIPLGQPIYYLNDTYGAVFLGITYPSTARTIDGNLTFTVTENTITLDTYTTYNVGVIGGCFNYNSKLYGMQALSGWPYGEYATSFTLFEEPEVVTPPAGLETADFPMNASENASTDYNATVKVGWAGNDVYIQGINKYLPEAWVKGTLNDEGTKVTFPVQYMGKDASSPYYLTGYTSKGNMPAVTMDYDADSKTFTGNGSIAMNSSSTSWAAVVFYNGLIIGTPPSEVEVPAGLETKNYAMEGKYTEDGETLVDIAEDYVVKIGVAEGVYYIQGLLPNVPEGWVQGTLADGKLTIPAGQYVGKDTRYGIGQYIVAGTNDAIEDIVLDYDATNDKFTTTSVIYTSNKKKSINWYIAINSGAIIGTRSAVNIADGIENGTVKVDKAKAFTGDVVTVTATPADGFKLDAITVKGADESAIEVSAENTFVMPAQAVTVSATFKDTRIIYDFAAAAAASENPENLNGSAANGAVFYGWENEGKTYSFRQDYKGYTNYTGTNLPAECHVWRRGDRINGNMTAADAAVLGLNCPNQKEMAINGLTAGQKVVIEYAGEGEILYATGFDAANPTAEPNTLAVVGDGNKAAVSGTTTIASGAPIHIVSTDNGYIVFRVLKGMVIKKITISEETPIDPATIVKPNIVTVAAAENGTVKVDKVQAFEGDVVTVTATPADGFKLDAITVKGADESAIEVSAENTFVMPAQAVTVSATFKDTRIIYDFAAAAAASENPENLNGSAANGAVFYGWENEGKTYSKRQDYKGYTNYTGTNLPAECHVWRRGDRINGNITAADAAVLGLNCPNQKEMAINGLTAGQKVVIEYAGEGEILYATGFDAANPTAEPNTLAVVGDGNKAAVSGTTTIASGAPIHIVSTDNGYIVFRVLKGMVIKKITISEETPIDPATIVKPNIVTVAAAENGTVKVDKVQAFEGDVVTVTATPADGFEMETITVKGADESAIEVSAENTFVMPAQAVTVSATFKKDTHSKSLNIEQLVLDKTTKADIAAILAEKYIEISSNAGLDSLNDEKTLRNEPFLGLKIKAADATVKVLVKKGNALNVKFGCVNDPVNVAINGTPIDTQVAKNTEGSVFTLPAAEADQEVMFTTTAKNTVVLKQIMIGEDIAAVTLPAATKYQVSVAEGIENGTVEFDATSITDSKGYKTVKVGDEVTIIAKPAEGYVVGEITVKGVTSNEAIVVTDGKFTMPADAVTINATFKVSTGINGVKANALKDAQIYNMQGVRVDKAQKGLYIVNGRKVVIK